MSRSLFWLAAAAAFTATSAFAAPIASTSKKGSLLIYPLVTVDPAVGGNTVVEISNDHPSSVRVECTYVNEWKGRSDFDFLLKGRGTYSWNVRDLSGDGVRPPPFPDTGNYPTLGNRYRGELICFATDAGLSNQISFNHLHGNATVFINGGSFKYNPWSFQALNEAGQPNPTNGVPTGEPGRIALTGLASSYDACPAYNMTTFMPNGATLGNVAASNNGFSFASCNQDLRQDFQLHLTKLQFEKVWNAQGQGYSGAYRCANSVGSTGLNATDVRIGTNFDWATLRTANARFQVQGVASTQCPSSERSGLLGIAWATNRSGTATTLIGSTMHGAGSTPGYVYWDPASGTVPLKAQ